jgi:beta-phosphoglucomutase family hydrolase
MFSAEPLGSSKKTPEILVRAFGGMMIIAVIFDMDGVIAETERVHIKAEKQTMLKYGIKISEEELHRYTGTTAKSMFTDLIRKYKLDTTFDKIFNEKEKILFKLLENNVQPTKGIIELLHKLKEMNIKLGIASSSHKRLVEYIVRKLKIAHFFDSVVSAEDIINSKPNPEIFLESAKRLKLNPAECLVVEDSKLGIDAAKKAGMKCLGYRNPSSGSQDLSKADFVTDDFSKMDILRLLS